MDIFTTMITPYKKNGEIDYELAERYVDWYFENGLTGIFAICQSSEIFFLSLSERVKLNSVVYKRAKELSKKSFDLAHKLFCECADLRRLASAALDLCYVAMGRIDMFFEYRLAPWDFAAGMLIVTEAGGRITDMKGNPLKFDKPTSVIASNNSCYYRLLSLANGK